VKIPQAVLLEVLRETPQSAGRLAWILSQRGLVVSLYGLHLSLGRLRKAGLVELRGASRASTWHVCELEAPVEL
jgi:hypothetical protein